MRRRIALATRIISLVGGLGSLTGVVYFGWESIRYRFLVPHPTPHVPIETSNVILRAADTAISVANTADKVLTAMAQGIADTFALASLLGLMVSAVLYRLASRA